MESTQGMSKKKENIPICYCSTQNNTYPSIVMNKLKLEQTLTDDR